MYRTELHSRTRSICPNVKDPQAGRVRSISLLPPKGTNQTCLHRSQAQSCDHSHWGLDRSCCYQLWSEKSKLPPENYDSTNYLLKYRTIHFTSQTFLNRSNYPLTQSGEVLLLRDDPVSLITIMMILGSHVISLLSLSKKKRQNQKEDIMEAVVGREEGRSNDVASSSAAAVWRQRCKVGASGGGATFNVLDPSLPFSDACRIHRCPLRARWFHSWSPRVHPANILSRLIVKQ